MSPAGGGLHPADLRQCGDGGQQALCFPRARQNQPAVEHHPRWPGALPPQTRPGPGGQRSDGVVLTPNRSLSSYVLWNYYYKVQLPCLSGKAHSVTEIHS